MSDDATLIQDPEQQHESVALSLGAVPALPGYQLSELLGEGSFGQVWAGVQLRTGQSVAVKILTRPGAGYCRYLEHEVARLGQVAEHPNVVTMLDADLQHDPPYLVMVRHPGGLQGWSAVGRPDGVAQVTRWLEQMASALEFTHCKGILHCDLKPSNVLLGEEGQARICDFGQSVGRGERSSSLGSLGTMSPEQAVRAGAPDVSWDIYSLGATAYILLTGHHPRLDRSDRHSLSSLSDSSERLSRYLELLRTRPLVSVRTLNPAVDRDLAAIVERCLEIDPARRTRQAGNVLEDLDRRRQRLPLLARQPWSAAYLASRFLRRRALEVILATVVVVFFSLLLAGKLSNDRATRTLLSRQEWDHGWTLYDEGYEGQALLWWARTLGEDPLRALATRSSSAPLRFFQKHPQPPDGLYYPSDGTLLVTSRNARQRWDVEHDKLLTDEHDGDPQSIPDEVGPYRLARASAGPLGNRILTGPGCVQIAHGRALLGDGQHLKVVSEDGKEVVLEDSPGQLKLGAVCGRWAAAADGQDIQVWDAASGRKLPVRLAHTDEVNSLELHSDGTRLVSSGSDNCVRIWELPSGRPLPPIRSHMGMYYACYSPQGDVLCTCCYDGTVRLYRSDTLAPLAPVLRHRWMVYKAVFSTDGSRLATCSVDGTARVWNARTGEPLSPFLEHASPVRLVAFNADASSLATGTLNGGVRVFALQPEPNVTRLVEPEENRRVVLGDWSPDGGLVALVRGGRLQLIDPGRRQTQVLEHPDSVTAMQFSPDGHLLASGCADGRLRVWELPSGKLQTTWEGAGKARSLVWNSRRLVCGGESGEVTVWTVGSDKPALRFTDDAVVKTGRVTNTNPVAPATLSLSPDGRLLACSYADGHGHYAAVLHDAESGQVLRSLSHPCRGVNRTVFSPDNRHFVTCGEDGTARLWELGQDRPGAVLQHNLPVWDAVWTLDGTGLVTASGDSTMQAWDRQGRPLTSPMRHRGPVIRLALDPTGRLLASASKDGTARVWSLRSGQQLMPAVVHDDLVYVARFSPDGKRLLTGSWDGSAKVADLTVPSAQEDERPWLRIARWTGMLLEVKGAVPRLRPLSPEEWHALP